MNIVLPNYASAKQRMNAPDFHEATTFMQLCKKLVETAEALTLISVYLNIHISSKSHAISRERIYHELFTNCLKPLNLGLDGIHGGLQSK